MQTLFVEPSALFKLADHLDHLAEHPPVAPEALHRCLIELQRAWRGGVAADLAQERIRQLARLAELSSPLYAGLHALFERHGTALPHQLDRDDAVVMQLSQEGDGRLVVSFGDPYTSRNVVTFVPGAGASLSSVGDELDRAIALRERAGPDTAVIMWLGYDPPDFADAMFESSARAAAEPLRRFQADLRDSHVGEIGQMTVIGHSYGSVVVGVAERGGDLVADDLVALGSPGMGVPSAAHLRDPGQVWASTAANDPIRHAPGFILGRDPDDPAFGARILPSAPMGHSGYLDPANPSLTAIAGLVNGG